MIYHHLMQSIYALKKPTCRDSKRRFSWRNPIAVMLIALGIYPMSGITSVLAAEYPYVGTFAAVFESMEIKDPEFLCALSFVQQRSDGNWFAYVVDAKSYLENREVKFEQIANGKCEYDITAKVEACATFIDKSFVEGEGKIFYDFVVSINRQTIVTRGFNTQTELVKSVSNGTVDADGLLVEYLRCPQSEESLMELVNSKFTDLSEAELSNFRQPKKSALDDPLLKSIVESVKHK